ncbi:MAG TPA: hypothetical protein DDW50_18590, partial [Firmicutes bacterium]|nr:hypothetical protein [Bacillota bacterium]
FVTELGSAIHQHQKILSVTVYAKTSENSNWTGPGAQDWSVLVNQADSLKIMAYDYHWVTSNPGPISPLDWLQDILAYARTIPGAKGKIIVGLPFYGIDWGTVGKEVMYQDAIGILSRYTYAGYSRDSVGGVTNAEIHFTYNDSGISHSVYFQDRTALRERLKVISQYRDIVKGVTFWHLGGEDPGNWNELKNYQSKP